MGEVICRRFQIVRPLGRGGMGEVYLADDLELRDPIALKTILPAQAMDDATRNRFRQEIYLARHVTHRNVCRIFDVYRHAALCEDGTEQDVLFVTMEYLAGETLSSRLHREGPLPFAEAVSVATQLADGLGAAHQAGIIHRDFKSANVMLVKDAAGDTRAVITDFGIAQTLSPVDAMEITDTTATLTHRMGVIGTPAYMAPEQLEGRPISFAADVYALGLVFFEMLTAKQLFAGLSVVSGAVERSKSPAALTKSGPIDSRWKPIIHRCLEYDPARRYQNAGAVADELRKLPGALRRKAITVLGALAAVVFVVLLLVKPIERFLHRVPEEKHLAVLPFRNIGGDPANASFCDGVVETLTSRLSQLERYQKSFWVVPASEGRRAKDLAEADRVLGVTLVITGSMERSGKGVRVIANLNDAHSRKLLASRTIDASAADLPVLEDRVWERVAEMLNVTVAPEAKRALLAGGTQVPGAFDYYQQGVGYAQRFGLDNLDQAIGLFQKALEQDGKYALAYAGLADAYSRKFDLTKDSSLIDAARRASEQALALNDRLPQVLTIAARIHHRAGQNEAAAGFWKKALEEDPASAESMMGLGRLYDDLGRTAEAENSLKAAVAMRPGHWATHTALGYFYYTHGQYDRAEPLFKTAMSLAPDNPTNYENLGGTYLLMGRYADAISVLSRSISLRETAPALSNLSTAYAFQQQFAQAIPLLERAVQLSPMNDRLWRNLGDAYAMIPAQAAKANGAYRKALETVQSQLKINPNSAATLSRAALYSAKLRDFTAAHKMIERARAANPKDNDVLFKGALVAELSGKRGEAVDAIDSAWKNGYSLEQIRKEPELTALREDVRFQSWLKRVSK